MQVKLVQAEIHQALIDFIAKKGIDINGQISIDITAGRKENGLFAEVDINYGASCAPVTTAANSVGCCNDTLTEAATATEAPTPWVEEAKEEFLTCTETEETQANKPLFGN